MKMRSNVITVIATVIVCAGAWLSVSLAGENGHKLTEAAKQAIAEQFPESRIEKVEMERRIIAVYEVSVVKDGLMREVTVTSEGVVLEAENAVDEESAPDAVSETIQKLAGDAELKEFERIEVRAELGAVQLKEPRIEYEAEFKKDGKEQSIRLSEQGKLASDEDEGEHEGDDAED